MAEYAGEVTRTPAEKEVLRSRLMSPLREVDEYVINDGVRVVEGRVRLSRQLTERFLREREAVGLMKPKKDDDQVREELKGSVLREVQDVKEVQDDFRVLVKWLVDDGVVTPEMAIKAGYFVRPSSVGMGKPDLMAYFIDPGDDHRVLTKMVLKEKKAAKLWGERSQTILPVVAHPEGTGIRLTGYGLDVVSSVVEQVTRGVIEIGEDERRDWAALLLLGHEYGHALLRAKHYERFEKFEGDISEAEEIWLDSWSRRLEARDGAGRVIKLLGECMDERVAVGMEMYVFNKLLEARGVDEATRQHQLDRYFADSVENLQREYLTLVEHGEEKGLRVEDLEEVEDILRRNGADVGNIGVFSGYGFPLTEDQLREFLR